MINLKRNCSVPLSIRSLLIVAAAVLLAGPSGFAAELKRLTRAELLDKIRGGWAGQMIGVSYGAPTEFRSNAKILEGELQWAPGRVDNALGQDDLYVEMTFSKVMDDLGLNATCEQYGAAFKDSQYHLWHANAGARRALGQGIKAPWSGHPKYNFHANDIDFQIEADFIGLMCPGLPRKSNWFCDRVGRVMNYGDGLYGGMFVCGMYSAAFFESDPRKVVEAGLKCIPERSEYARLVRDLLDASARSPKDWRKVWQEIETRWDKDDPCPDGALQAFNIDAKLNGAYIAFGLLFGELDFLKTMEISTRCGQDSDCNPSSAAGVLGVMLGYNRIPENCKGGIAAIADKKFSFTDYSFNDIVKSTEVRALKVIQETGGKVGDTEVEVRVQSPKASKLEQWSPGIPDRRIKVEEAAWTFEGNWTSDKGAKVSSSPGNAATLSFDGVAVAVLGGLTQDGGRADVFLDGKRLGAADAYIVERTHDNVLWNIYGLKPGAHKLRIVTVDGADPRSRGKRLALHEAVVYRKSATSGS
jgi:hypothetical protein